MLHKVKIATRLWIAVSITLLFFIGIIMIGMVSTDNIYSRLNSMIEDRYNKIELIYAIDNQNDSIAESFMDIFLVKHAQSIDHAWDSIRGERNLITKELNELTNIMYTERGRTLLANLYSAQRQYNTIMDDTILAIKEKPLDSHQLLINNIKENHLRCRTQIKSLLEFQRTRCKEIANEIGVIKYKNTTYISGLFLIICTIMISMSLWIIFSINRPIRKLCIFLEQISRGNIPQPILEEWDGEFDYIREHINVMNESIGALIALDKYSEQTLFRNTTEQK